MLLQKTKKISPHKSGKYEWVFENEGDRIHINVAIVNVNEGDRSKECQLIIDCTFAPHNVGCQEQCDITFITFHMMICLNGMIVEC